MRALCQSETGAKEPLSFETSVIKPIAEGTPISMSGCLGGPGSNDPGRVNCEYVTLRMLLMRAYQLKAPELIGPGWLDTVYFNITATVPKGATKDQAPAMFRELSAAVRSLNALTQRNGHLHTLSYLTLPQTKLSAASVLPVPL
jgi:hypothetical protein